MKKKTGIVRIFYSIIYVLKGLKVGFGESAFRQEIFLFLLLSILGYYLADSTKEWLFLVASLLFVLIVELINTAIEKVTDLVSPKYNQLAGKIKDLAAATVFLSIIVVTIIWIAILAF